MSDALARHYAQLTAAERFRLVVLARARGDEAEEDRLVDACPRMLVEMNDPQFGRHWLTAQDLVMAFVADIGRFVGWLQALDFLIAPVGQILDDLDALITELGGSDGTAQPSSDEAGGGYPLRAMRVAAETALAAIATHWEAFSACCREEMEVEPEELLRAIWPQALETIEALRPRLEPNPRRDRAWVEEMRAHWRELAGEVWRTGLQQE